MNPLIDHTDFSDAERNSSRNGSDFLDAGPLDCGFPASDFHSFHSV